MHRKDGELSLQLGRRVTENGLKGFVTFVCNPPPQKKRSTLQMKECPDNGKNTVKFKQVSVGQNPFLFNSVELMHFSGATSKRMQDVTVGVGGLHMETCETGSWGQHSARPLFRSDNMAVGVSCFFLFWRAEEDHRGRRGRGSSYGTADLLRMAFPFHQPCGLSHEQKRQPCEDGSPPTARVTV